MAEFESFTDYLDSEEQEASPDAGFLLAAIMLLTAAAVCEGQAAKARSDRKAEREAKAAQP